MKNIIKIHDAYKSISLYIYYASLSSILVGLLFSRAMISIGFISFTANWIIEGNYRTKWSVFKQNKSFVVVSGIFFIYLAGLMYSSDIQTGIESVKIKLPLLLPFFFFSAANFIESIKQKYFIALFGLSVLVKTIILFVQFQLTTEFTSIEDVYKIAFYSNIRLGLFTVFSIFSLLYYLLINKIIKSILLKVISIAAIAWMTYFLYFLSSLTSYLIFLVLCIYIIYVYLRNKSAKNYKMIFTVVLIITFVSSMSFLSYNIMSYYNKDKIDFGNLPQNTVNGNRYTHDTLSNFTECGHYVNLYVCKPEMKALWNSKSKLPFDGEDLKGQNLSNTIKRYLSSKNLRKDSVGLSKLSDTDIRYIENGCANYLYTQKYSIAAKIYHILWQLDIYFRTGDAGDKSISQRIEYYMVSRYIMKDNLWFGVGTGDLLNETIKVYEKLNTKTDKKYWYQVHNQFIYACAGFGIIGCILFLLFFLYPMSKKQLRSDFLFASFYITIFISFLSDNTLETQLGLSFFVVFYCLLAVRTLQHSVKLKMKS